MCTFQADDTRQKKMTHAEVKHIKKYSNSYLTLTRTISSCVCLQTNDCSIRVVYVNTYKQVFVLLQQFKLT